MNRVIRTGLACVLLFLGGCKPADPTAAAKGDGGGFTHTIKASTEYYIGGPQQARPPDGQWAAGTKVKLLENNGSYSQVEAQSGQKAYVSTDALAPIR